MAGEGNPDEPGQARSQMSEHVKVVGLRLDWWEYDSDTMLSLVLPVSITCGNGAESASD